MKRIATVVVLGLLLAGCAYYGPGYGYYGYGGGYPGVNSTERVASPGVAFGG